MTRIAILLAALALAGCLGSHPKEPSFWTVEAVEASVSARRTDAQVKAKLGEVDVRSPYDGSRFAILRADGSLAFDPYNSFAARLPALLKGITKDVLAKTLGADFTATSSKAEVRYDLEVERFALDCRSEGTRIASVTLTLVEISRSGEARAAKGKATASAADGNYTKAFSQAFADALTSAAEGFSAK